ncbi:MAG: Fic family protein [Parachlamydiales bacterium]
MEAVGNALARVREVADRKGVEVLQSSEINRSDREALVRQGWLTPIIRGWYLFLPPGVMEGDSAAWYAHLWDFLALYLTERFGSDYCLSAESSIELHLESTITPPQVTVITSKGGGGCQALPYNTSVFVYADPPNLPHERVRLRGVQAMPLALTLCKLPPLFFHQQPTEAALALRLVRDPADLVRMITTHGFTRAAGRLVGAYRRLNPPFAQVLETSLHSAGIRFQPTDPFEAESLFVPRSRSPVAARVESLWKRLRSAVLQQFPEPPTPITPEEYLLLLEQSYLNDAYNSLSIEGYRVDLDLIARVRNHEWDPEHHPEDAHERNALAARGYYEAFRAVEATVREALTGKAIHHHFAQRIQGWYQALWNPFIQAEIMKPADLAGYRSFPVYIRGSRHTPPAPESLIDAMESLEGCLAEEESPAVRAVLGHYFLVYIHPYMDGNGRMARFVMNAMLASGGYPWIIIRTTRRQQYFRTLEQADVEQNIGPFTHFLLEEMRAS